MFPHVGFLLDFWQSSQERQYHHSRETEKFATDYSWAFCSETSRTSFFEGVTIMSDQVLGNQEKILANQTKIITNQKNIEGNQSKLEKVLTNQEKILTNQEKILAKR
jgi:hypothetical protein